ncbi:MAG: methyltransferase [Pseudomonadota bacterium]
MPPETAPAENLAHYPPAASTTRPGKSTSIIAQFRRRLVANPRFRRFVERAPLLRRLASSSANEVFALTSGFINSQILLACEELDLFDALATGPASPAELARQWQMTPDRASTLLTAAEGLKLVYRTGDGQFGLDEYGIVIAQSPGIRAMIRHHAAVYRDLTDPVALLRAPKSDTQTSSFWSYVGEGDAWGRHVGAPDAAQYSTLMRLSQAMVIEQVLDAYPIGRHHARLIDIGGGNGAFITGAAKRWDTLNVGVFDLPAVAENASEQLAGTSFADRLSIYGGSFFEHQIPPDADCYSLIRVLYDHNDDAALSILRNVRAAMAPGDVLVIGEPMAGEKAGERLVQAYFSIYLLAMQSGKCRSAGQLSDLARKAGFADIRQVATALPVISGLLVAKA